MQVTTAKRLEGIGEYYFSQKLREIEQLRQQGKPIINLGIGSPDLPPHPSVIQVLHDESSRSDVHAYQSYKGSPVLRRAMCDWYKTWYQVDLNPDTEVLPLIGSKEGIMHICMTYLNEGDAALIPNPGYPTYSAAVTLAGGQAIPYLLQEENGWQPDLHELESHDLSRVKLMFLNYPHMPTGQQPSVNVLQQLIAFAQQHNILIVHDNPYSFILNKTPLSLLSLPEAKEVVLELNSLSKSQNMAGWRIGMLCAAKERIDEVLRFKSNMDSGMYLPVQLAAAKALQLRADWYEQVNAVYEERRHYAFELLDLLQCKYSKEQVGMFVWAGIPAHYESGYILSDKILYETDVFITPGGIFGSAGDRYIRVSLCSPVEKLKECISRIKAHIEK